MKNFPSVKKRNEFEKIYRSGRRFFYGSVVVFILKNPENTGNSRIGISISRKKGNSVERHRFQRRVREVFRTSAFMNITGYDVLISARDRAENISFYKITEVFDSVLEKMRF